MHNKIIYFTDDRDDCDDCDDRHVIVQEGDHIVNKFKVVGIFGMVAVGPHHFAYIAAGYVFTWGEGGHGRLGHGDEQARQVPTKLDMSLFGDSRAVMVACGKCHTMVLTRDGALWTFGGGAEGVLGHGDETDRLVPTRVDSQSFEDDKVAYVSVNEFLSITATASGNVFVWGQNTRFTIQDSAWRNGLAPGLLHKCDFGGESVRIVSTGLFHSMAVTVNGNLFAYGLGLECQLGLGDGEDQVAEIPIQVRFPAIKWIVQVACGEEHTLAFTDTGLMYTWGAGSEEHHEILLPNASCIVNVAVGDKFSAVTNCFFINSTLCQ